MFNYKALKKWRNRCNLTQDEVAAALSLAERTSITTYENGRVNIPAKNLGMIIKLFSTRLKPAELNEFLTELFDITVSVDPQTQAIIDYKKWNEDKDDIIRLKKEKITTLEQELKECLKLIDYAKKNCTIKTCVIMQRLKKNSA